jgi:hypothetical protein
MPGNENFNPVKLFLNPLSEYSYSTDFLFSIENILKNSSCQSSDPPCSLNGTLKVSVWVISKGLLGRYFDNLSLTGSPKITKTDETMDFSFGSSIYGITNGNFGVIWTGLIFPSIQNQTLSISGDDSASLFIDGEEVLNLKGKTQFTLPDSLFFFIEVRYNNSDSSGAFKLANNETGEPLTGQTLGHFKHETFVSGAEGSVLVN